MKLWGFLLFLQLWGNVKVSFSQNEITCETGSFHPQLFVAGIQREALKVGHKLRFSCGAEYKLEGSEEAECSQSGQWNPPIPTCSEISCEIGSFHPQLFVAGVPPLSEALKVGHKLSFSCGAEYELDGSEEAECSQSGQWNPPIPTCSERCRVPDLPENVRLTPSVRGSLMSKGEKIMFDCLLWRHFIHGKNSIECLGNGEWSDEPPTCKQGRPGCGKPPDLTDGDFLGIAKSEYRYGERVEYVCQNKYTLDGQSYKTCNNGVWTGDMRCLKPCIVDTETMDRHNIQFLRASDKLYAPHNDHLMFVCKSGTTADGLRIMRKQCIDGVMELPTCSGRV